MTGARDPRQVAWAASLGLTLLVAIFPQFALGALGPQLRAELQLGPADLGVVFAGLYLVGVVGSPIAGPIVDRIGGRRACLGLLVGSGAALLLASLATSRLSLIVAVLPGGAAMAFANPGTNRWAAAAPTARAQTTLVGVAQAGVQAGALGAGALAAMSAFGLDWRGALRVGTALAVAGLVVAARSPDDRARSVATTAAGASRRTSAGSDERRRMQRWLAAYALLMGAGSAIVFAYLPSFAVDVAGLSVAAAGATTMVFGGVALLCRLGLGVILRHTEHVGPALLVAMSLGSVVAVTLVSVGGGSPWALWVGAIVFGATGTTWPAIAFLAVVRTTPPATAGRVTGWVASAFYLGLWVTPPLAGWAITEVGYGTAWIGAAACYLMATGPAAATRRVAAAR